MYVGKMFEGKMFNIDDTTVVTGGGDIEFTGVWWRWCLIEFTG